MRTERRAGVPRTEDPALLQERDDGVDEVVETARGEVRDEDETVGGVRGDVLLQGRG
ncbi:MULTISPECIES: hypothetical protein [Streptomyces]|uniref:hypothetical protein n=1 Tax=Streptomyces TaxID=1883 RepID=UPI001390F4E3|nr:MULTISPECIES: hypothetical protein [Streptomyces]GGT75517.1 hypothetical protein GCM10010272_18460 [Streptomyces lateritius]